MKNFYVSALLLMLVLCSITTQSQNFRHIYNAAEVAYTYEYTSIESASGSSLLSETDYAPGIAQKNIITNVSWAIGNNTINSDQIICYNTIPVGLTGSIPTGGNGTFSYQWQNSTASATTGFTDITDSTRQDYAPGSIIATTWYRRIVISGSESDTSVAVQITVNPIPTATITYTGSPYCGTGTATVTQTGQGGGTFSSSTGLSINALTGAINLASSTPGPYTVNYSFSDGLCTNTVTTNVQVGNPVVLITNPAPVCSPSTINLTDAAITAGSTENLTYTYFTNSGGTIAVSNPSALSATGTKTYYIRGTSAAGCKTIKPVTFTINPQPIFSAIGPFAPVCKGSAVTLTAFSPDPFATFDWQNAGAGPSVVVYPMATTSYTVTAKDAKGCTKPIPVPVQVKDFSVSIAANPNPVIAGTTVTFSSSADANYQVTGWLPQAYFTNQTATSQSINLRDTTKTFSVIGKSDEGCIDTASVRLQIDANTKDVFIPNAFTPNNDGRNDIFKVYGSSVTGADIRIYNQWGALLFETGENNSGWDGTYKGKPQPVGVYLYSIKIRLSNEDTYIKKGSLNLIR